MNILTVTFNPCIDKTITMDGFNYGGLNRADTVREDVGGKGINVAKVLRSFGAPCIAYAMVAGQNGQKLEDFLLREGIDALFTKVQGEIRTNHKIVNTKDRITTEINEKGFAVSEDDCASAVETIEKALEFCDILVLAGSIPNGMDDRIYADLIKLANSHDVKVILDADTEKLKHGIAAKPYAIKPNLYEFELLTGKKLDTTDVIVSEAKKLIQKGIELVVVSMGADGAVFADRGGAYKAEPFAIECKSTVGAGDSMVAAMAYSIYNGLSLEEMAKLSIAAGSITSSKEGTDVCMAEEVMARKDVVKIFAL